MKRTETPKSEPSEAALQDLIEAIYSGSIADVDELSEVDIRLLRDHFQDEEDLAALFDRLRGPKRED